MATHPTTGFDLDQTDLLLTTTKQVRKRLDLSRPVPHEELLECIDIASHASMGGNLERNRWMIIDDPETKAKISEYFGAVGRPYLQANTEAQRRSEHQGDRFGDVPRRALARGSGAGAVDAARPCTRRFVDLCLRGLLRLGPARRVELPARRKIEGDRLGVDHVPLEHEAEVAKLLGIPSSVTQVCLLAVGYHTGDSFSPAPRRPASEVTYLNRWKAPVE